MSRVGKYPVMVPNGVTVAIKEGKVTAHGKQGVLSLPLVPEVDVSLEEDKVWVKPRGTDKFARAMWGTTRANIRNMVLGVNQGFAKRLDIVGVGYKAAVQGKVLNLALGFSHDVVYPIPDDVVIRCDSPTAIAIGGPSKERVGQVAAEIRSYRPPEPYKGKGIKYANERILRKEGKKK
ncbi:MAG: large subunit ribosomal protein L6 [Rhodospirillaceae bacterium]|nr:MAG: large subunit ribosomal protein L6 [Rhodospirillaceae bacterium]